MDDQNQQNPAGGQAPAGDPAGAPAGGGMPGGMPPAAPEQPSETPPDSPGAPPEPAKRKTGRRPLSDRMALYEALVAALDLVISVDTSVAHLAGALGDEKAAAIRATGASVRAPAPTVEDASTNRPPAFCTLAQPAPRCLIFCLKQKIVFNKETHPMSA